MSEFCAVNLSIVDGVWIKQMAFAKKGWIAQTHAHTFDHQTLLPIGRLRVTVDGESREYQAPSIILIKAGALHRLESLEDGTVAYCVHRLDEGETVVKGISNHDLHSLA